MQNDYSFMHWYLTYSTGTAKHIDRKLIDTVRLKLLNVVVKAVHTERYIKFKLCSSSLYKAEVYNTFENI